MDEDLLPHPISATLTLLGCASVVAAHVAVLYTSGLDPISTPVSTLSRVEDGNLHGLGLSLFALSQVALAGVLHRPDAGWPTRVAQLLLLVDAALVIGLAYRFGAASDAALSAADANAPLWVLASGTGLVMALIAPGLLKRYRGAGIWDLVCLVLWLALAVLFLAVETSWLGAYERLVGIVFVLWTAGLAALLGFRVPRPSA